MNEQKPHISKPVVQVPLDAQAATNLYDTLMKMTAEQLKDWKPTGPKKPVSQTPQARIDLMQELRESLLGTKVQTVSPPLADDTLKLVS